ncbi:hypothetical protein H0H87_003874 [Tephrocybe sp. NHM501043]|nr:hypothetical protein H0H87_003874 [Tephrocybe sp. NHM501043]
MAQYSKISGFSDKIKFLRILEAIRQVTIVCFNRCLLAVLSQNISSPVVSPRVESISLYGGETRFLDSRSSDADIAEAPLLHAENLVAISRGLVNLKEFDISGGDALLFRTWLPQLRTNLRTLSLRLSKHSKLVENLLPSSTNLPNVESLSLHLNHTEPSVFEFINGLNQTLISLSIHLPHPPEPSDPTFQSRPSIELLGRFPFLTQFTLGAWFNRNYSLQPAGLNRFLLRHGNIQSLTLSLDFSYHCVESTHTRWYDDIVKWNEQSFQGVSPVKLDFLNIKFFGINNITPRLIEPLRPLSQTLSSLSLSNDGRFLEYEQVTFLVDILTSPFLKKVDLTVTTVNPQLLDLLAIKCRNLDQLVLNIDRMSIQHDFDLTRDPVSLRSRLFEYV